MSRAAREWSPSSPGISGGALCLSGSPCLFSAAAVFLISTPSLPYLRAQLVQLGLRSVSSIGETSKSQILLPQELKTRLERAQDGPVLPHFDIVMIWDTLLCVLM